MFKSTQDISAFQLRRRTMSKKMKRTTNPNENSPILYVDVLYGKYLCKNGKKFDLLYCVVEYDGQENVTDVAHEKSQSSMSEVLEWGDSFMFQAPHLKNNTTTTTNSTHNNNSSSNSTPTTPTSSTSNSALKEATDSSSSSNDTLRVHVYSRKFLAKDFHLGTIVVPLNTLTDEGVTKKWFKLAEVDGITGSVMLKLQYTASDRGRMNLLQELIPENHYAPLVNSFGNLSTRNFVVMFDNDTLIPNAAEIESLLKLVINSETNTLNRNSVMKLLVDSEVRASASNVGTLFRRNSLCSKLLTSYMNYYGQRYLQARLQTFVQTLNDEDEELEVDPHRINPNSDQKVDVKKNMKIVLKKTEQLIKEITDLPNEVPYELRESNGILAQSIAEIFAEQNKNNCVVQTAVGGAMFLRFICPALTSPHLYGLLQSAPTRKAHRTLMIVTKILQNLANGVEFGKKEDFMTKANKLIKKQKKPFTKFVEAIIAQNLTPSVGDDVEPSQLVWSLYNLHSYLYKNWATIVKALMSPKDCTEYSFSILTGSNISKQEVSEILMQLTSVKEQLDKLGEPIKIVKAVSQ